MPWPSIERAAAGRHRDACFRGEAQLWEKSSHRRRRRAYQSAQLHNCPRRSFLSYNLRSKRTCKMTKTSMSTSQNVRHRRAIRSSARVLGTPRCLELHDAKSCVSGGARKGGIIPNFFHARLRRASARGASKTDKPNGAKTDLHTRRIDCKILAPRRIPHVHCAVGEKAP